MKLLSEKTYYRLFELGILGKAIISAAEIISGVILLFVSYDSLRRAIFSIFGGELNEDPHDFLWKYAVRSFRDFTTTPQSVWAFIFLSHGLIKIFLLVGLWRNKLWAYPASAVVFAGFIAYQLYQLTYTPSVFLWLITFFDLVVIGLILHEYRRRRAHIMD